MTHWMPASEAFRCSWMAGLATATIVPSSATIITPSATASRVRPGRPRAGGRRPASTAGLPPRATAAVAVFVSITLSLSRRPAPPELPVVS